MRLNPIVAFWMAYVVTRPLGASFADWISKPREQEISGGGAAHARPDSPAGRPVAPPAPPPRREET